MIALPEFPYVENDELNEFTTNFVVRAITDRLKAIIKCYEDKEDYDDLDIYYDPHMLELYFPKNFPEGNEEQMLYIMKGLYSLMISKHTWVPSLIMEYVLAHVIMEAAYDFDDSVNDFLIYNEIKLKDQEQSYQFFRENYLSEKYCEDEFDLEYNQELLKGQDKEINIPFSDELFKKLTDAYYQYYENFDDEEFDDEWCKKEAIFMVDNIWHYSFEWLEWCFWDNDYTLLDGFDNEEDKSHEDISVGELRMSFINKAFGIMSTDSSDDDFILPEDWEHSKDFRFCNQEPRQ